MEKEKLWNHHSLVFIFNLIQLVTNNAAFSDLNFVVEPNDVIVIKDSPAILNCSAVGNPPPVIEWKKDGLSLDFLADDNRRTILRNGSLSFSRVFHSRIERPDEGLYQCTASIPGVGTIISREVKLQVASLPPFDQSPNHTTVYQHQTVYFPCSIQGIPPATIRWFKNEQPLYLDQTRMTILPSGALEIDDATSTDAGTYHCTAVSAGKTRKSDFGNLTVTMDYVVDDRESPPAFIATPPKTTVVHRGSNLTLDCAANGNPKPRIDWLKDGSDIDFLHLGSRFRRLGSGSLIVENVIETDVGTYVCRAVNSVDSVDTMASVDVVVPPQFIRKPENSHAQEKEDIILHCEVYGKPTPIVQWYKNGDRIIQSDYFQILQVQNEYNLKILGLVKTDSGIYQCYATNSAGSIQSTAQLIVTNSVSSDSTTFPTVTFSHSVNIPGELQYHKDAPSEPVNVTAVIVETRFIALSWQHPLQRNEDIIGYYIFYRDESSQRERVLNSTVKSVNIQSLLPDTTYLFRVIAYNSYGPGLSSKPLSVHTQSDVLVPSSPNSLLAIPLSSTSVLVKWKPPQEIEDPVEYYKLFYVESGSTEEHEISTKNTSLELHDLKKFTAYLFWVTAFNSNGPGSSTDEVKIRTYSDVPSETPQNISLEPANSTSIYIRWDPPPIESQNGIITGYKIRYKQSGKKGGDTFATDGSRRSYTLTGLEKGVQYMVKIAALSVNGTGPFTEWKTAETYYNDLDEVQVPDKPSSLRARPSSNSIFVSWGPPKDQSIIVRGYTIGWGIGLPDVYSRTLDAKHRYFNIENLQPSSEYVISLRAFNHAGDSITIYETVKTEVESTPEPFTPMLPPVGLKAIVLSSSTVVLYWTDTTLSRNQLITDNRYYTVRYTTYTYSLIPKYRFFNSTDLNCMIDDLKPNTQYEFSVKVVKERKESTWSMSVLNTTEEAAPSSPPRDLTVVALEDDSSVVNLHWQPPKQPNGHITGYVIFYTTDKTQRDRDWVVEGVVGDKMTSVLKGLSLDTTYYFKIQARNNKGYGPLSSEISFHTAAGLALASGSALFDNKGFTSSLWYIIITCICGITLLVIIVVSVVVCRRRNGYLAADNFKSYKSAKGNALKNKNAAKELVPPDLWIHHDQMELKSMDKSNVSGSNMTLTPIQRNSQDLGQEPLLSTLEKKKSAYLDSIHDELLPNNDKCIVKCRPIRATPIKISLDHQKPLSIETSIVTSGSGNIAQSAYEMGTNSLGRPMYPRTQYNIHRTPTCHEGHQAVTLGDPPPPPPLSVISHGPTSSYDISENSLLENNRSVTFIPTLHENPESGSSNTLTKRQASHQNSLRSFTTPTISSQSVPPTPLPKHISLKSSQVSSPHKKVTLHTPGELNSSQSSPQSSKQHAGASTSKCLQEPPSSVNREMQASGSTEQLNQEMANHLEGLMKDLNAITASEFQC